MLFWEMCKRRAMVEKGLRSGSRIYGRLRAAADKIICLFDLLFSSRGRV